VRLILILLALLMAVLVTASEDYRDRPKCIKWRAKDGDYWGGQSVCLEWSKPKDTNKVGKDKE